MITASGSLRSWLHFANLQLSARVAGTLLAAFNGDPAAVLKATDAELDAVPWLQEKQRLKLRDPLGEPTDRQLAWIERQNVQVLARGCPEYPPCLEELHDPPPVLFVRGELTEADTGGIAMVGSRRATPYGLAVAQRFGRELAGRGVTVVSGGAIGIDAAAHRGALEGGGRTLAILGCGLDVDYPRGNRKLFEAILACGALISEYPPGAQPDSWHFPMRNRIISAMSLGVIVIEAPPSSGSLITAQCAAEQGRMVMAVPGNIDRETAQGTNDLIKDGAVVVTRVEDALEAVGLTPITSRHPAQMPLAIDVSEPKAPSLAAFPEPARTLMASLSLTPRHVDGLAEAAGISAAQAGAEMTLLELGGHVRRLPGNNYVRTG